MKCTDGNSISPFTRTVQLYRAGEFSTARQSWVTVYDKILKCPHSFSGQLARYTRQSQHIPLPAALAVERSLYD